jgi:hypothetical protein
MNESSKILILNPQSSLCNELSNIVSKYRVIIKTIDAKS